MLCNIADHPMEGWSEPGFDSWQLGHVDN